MYIINPSTTNKSTKTFEIKGALSSFALSSFL